MNGSDQGTRGGNGSRDSRPSRTASGVSNNDEELELETAEVEEDDEDAILEKRRLRRLAILAKHSNPGTPSDAVGQSAATVVPDPVVEVPEDGAPEPTHPAIERVVKQGGGGVEARPTPDSMDSPASFTAAELSPVDLPETLATTGAETTQDPELAKESAAAGVTDGLDMFGSFDVASAAQKNKSKTGTTDIKDSWADSDGYYKHNPGEMLDNRYRIRGYSGSGVFSNVVRAEDTKDEDMVRLRLHACTHSATVLDI